MTTINVDNVIFETESYSAQFADLETANAWVTSKVKLLADAGLTVTQMSTQKSLIYDVKGKPTGKSFWSAAVYSNRGTQVVQYEDPIESDF